ncbi:MAG: FG-GAP repeat domain-containing protein [Limisphaerales bacterium]
MLRANTKTPKPGLRLAALIGLLAAVGVIWFVRKQYSPPAKFTPTNALQLVIAFEDQAAQQYWKPELEAQQRLRTVTDLWDAINRSTNKLATALSQFNPTELIIPNYTSATELPHNIRVATPTSSEQPPYSRLLDLARDWQLDQCEFRFIGVNPDTFYVSLHLTKPQTQTRAILEGNVIVQFSSSNTIARVDASRLELRTRTGPPAFAEMFHAEVPPPAGSYFIDPLIVWDLNSDSQLEVILAAANVVIRRTPEGTWTPERLPIHDPGLIFAAMFGDFSSNGTVDLLTVKFEGIYLFEGSPDGTFPHPPRQVWTAQPRLQYAQALTAGDIDRDGDLDLFLVQYKLPFNKGQMPFPYFDANDGYPSFLLSNDGAGNFSDITQRAGLSAKRARRTYSTSLVDLDRDADLDLILISDFSGLDAFENNGSGQFTDATKKWFDDTAALGMAHSFADFDRDGLLDLIMVGMNSPSADRLASLKLSRPYDAPDAGQRDAITFGNRLYFGTTSGRFVQRPISAQVARTGWSWGSAAADFDNDGFPELYIANGHASRASTHDYESEFWLHDIYVGTSQENSLAESYFRKKLNDALTTGHSYGGYERNRLFLNQRGTNFVEVAHLFGLALPEDSRNVAGQDLDRDGRIDLIVTTFENYPTQRQTIRFYRNKLEHVGNHTLVTLTNALYTGASAQLITRENGVTHTNAFTILSGESMRTQLPPQQHMGLGQSTAVESRATKNIFRSSAPANSAPLSP